MLTLQFTLAARYLWGRELRSFLTTLAVIFGVMAALVPARQAAQLEIIRAL